MLDRLLLRLCDSKQERLCIIGMNCSSGSIRSDEAGTDAIAGLAKAHFHTRAIGSLMR